MNHVKREPKGSNLRTFSVYEYRSRSERLSSLVKYVKTGCFGFVLLVFGTLFSPTLVPAPVKPHPTPPYLKKKGLFFGPDRVKRVKGKKDVVYFRGIYYGSVGRTLVLRYSYPSFRWCNSYNLTFFFPFFFLDSKNTVVIPRFFTVLTC